MIKIVVWGVGDRKNYIKNHIGVENIVAYVDNNPKKVGTKCDGLDVISFETYLKKYRDYLILITTHEGEIIEQLEKKNIFHYLLMSKCPSDFQVPIARDLLKEELQNRVDRNKKYIVCGYSLYSLIVMEWFQEINIEASLCIGKNCDRTAKSILKKYYDSKLLDYINEIKADEEVLVTVEDNINYMSKEISFIKKNILWLAESIEKYRNPLIEQFKNIHKERKRCFIVATGPSLRVEDINLLRESNEICISMNSIYYIYNQTEWRPDYYVVVDKTELGECSERFAYMKKCQCFIADTNEEFCSEEHPKNVFIYHLGKIWAETGYIPFSEDFAGVVYNTATVTYVAIELAVYLGFKEIYLLGVDATGINGNYESYGHFHAYDNNKSTCFGKQVLVSYRSAKKYADEHDIKIYNATRGGELEVFPRVDFDELF